MKLLDNLDVDGKQLLNAKKLTITTAKGKSKEYSVKDDVPIDLSFSVADKVTKANGDFDVGESFDQVAVTDILKRLIYGYTPPSMNLSGTGDGTIEVGALKSSVITCNVTKGSRELSSLTTSPDLGFTVKAGSQTKSVDFSAVKTIQTKSYSATLKDAKNPATTITKSINYVFALRTFNGICDSVPLSSIPAKNTDGTIRTKGTWNFAVTTKDNQFYWFAIPKEWGGTVTVIDPNNFDITASFDTKEVSFTNQYNITSIYTLYYTKKAAGLSNFRITVKIS